MKERSESGKYKGWRVHTLRNKWFTIHLAPDLGGRIIQVDFGGHEFFFVNPSLVGVTPGTATAGWLNFGGEKIWPAPQGWGTPECWPGPPDPVLDGGVYELEVLPGNRVAATSPADEYTGLQIRKEVALRPAEARIAVHGIFVNRSRAKRRWSVWPVIQMNTSAAHEGGRYVVTCPVNPASTMENGFKVMHGLVNNPQFLKGENGHLAVDYRYLMGKVGLDSDAGWVTFTDLAAGKVFVVTFSYEAGAVYPDDTSVQIWTQGRGMIYSRNRIAEFPDNPAVNPPYLEIELLSPLYEMSPGEEVAFKYGFRAATVRPGEKPVDVGEAGVTMQALEVSVSGSSSLLTGSFGVFTEGIARLRTGVALVGEWEVSPLKAFTLDLPLDGAAARTYILELFDPEGRFVGELSRLHPVGNDG